MNLRTKTRTEKEQPKGFTLMELLVSIAIFAIVSVLMSNIVLSIATFSVDAERRTDFLNELDGIANTIKNDLRAAGDIGFCNLSGNIQGLYYRSKPNSQSPTPKHYVLSTVSESDGSKLLVWREAVYTEASNSCAVSTSVAPRQISSKEMLTVKDVRIARSCEDHDCAPTAKNTLLFILLDTCDPVSGNSRRPIFHCTNNPYRYEMAISTRITK